MDMVRRSHRKSRAGCSECKRRHIKCDEGRPACGNCTISSRYCSFLSTQPRLPVVGEGSASSSSPSLHNRPLDSSPAPNREIPNIEVANMVHMELFYHCIHSNIFDLPPSSDDPEKRMPSAIIIDTALSYPFLMNEMLAFSALHLSHLQPSKSQLYKHHAIGLQTHALGIFNGEGTGVTRDNCIAILIFTWFMALHTLSGTVESAESADIHSFLDRFVHCMQLHLGLQAVTGEAWYMMLESKMGFVLEAANNMLKCQDPELHTADLKDCIRDSKTLSDDEKMICTNALDQMQWFLSQVDEIEKKDPSLVTTFLSLISWPAMINVEFHQLVAERVPEALIVLSYHAIPLHLCRNIWVVRNAGQLLFQSVRVHLPDEWHRWLDWPEKMMNRISADP
ncbi:hypothetical protein F4781DRAFT_146789 [Annulohypoxylon bovei var. microspora]|nr:hypothetical protein F4781DRAFT_146789 [Annulohypoxylon bovei var. microspora]